MNQDFQTLSDNELDLIAGGKMTEEAHAWVERNLDTLLKQQYDVKHMIGLGIAIMSMTSQSRLYELQDVKDILIESGYNLNGLT